MGQEVEKEFIIMWVGGDKERGKTIKIKQIMNTV